MKTISKSKRQLAQLLIEAGVAQFPEYANWAAQDADMDVNFFTNKPHRELSWWQGEYDCADRVPLSVKITNWHQTVLSRAEFDQIVAETAPDADGWIEWHGGECPVYGGALVVCKNRTGKEWRNGKAIKAEALRWSNTGDTADIIAYRLHKPEQSNPEFCESVTRSIPEPEVKPTIEQLAADYRNAKDYAERKQNEADDAKADANAKLKALELASEALGFLVTPITAKQESELVITDWRDLQVGDEIIIDFVADYSDWKKNLEGKVSTIVADGVRFPICATNESCPAGESWFLGAPIKINWRFIRRP